MARRLQRTRLRGPDTGAVAGDGGRGHAEAQAVADAHPVAALSGSRSPPPAPIAQLRRVRAEVDELERSVKGRTESLARRFDRVLRLLDAWGHLDGWALTEKGDAAGAPYHECDLLIAEALEAGLLDDLDPASLAGLVSVFTYEHRSSAPPPAPWFPSQQGARAVRARSSELAEELQADEHRAGLHVDPRSGSGVRRARVRVGGRRGPRRRPRGRRRSPGGDFVRNVKQLIDLLRQLGQTSRRDDGPRSRTRRPTSCSAA